MHRREFLYGTIAVSAFPKLVFASSDALIVHRTETCGCCGAWVERMNSSGLKTEVNFVNETSLTPLKVKYILGFSKKSWKLIDFVSGL